MNKRYVWNGIWIFVSLVLALGFNNITRQLKDVDSGLIAFLTFSSLIFLLGTLIYTTEKANRNNNIELVLRFILSGILIIMAFSLGGFVGDVKEGERIMAFFSFDIFSVPGLFIAHLMSLFNYGGLTFFFYSCFELICYLKEDNYKNSDRKMTYAIAGITFLIYFFGSGLFFFFIDILFS